MCAPLQAAEREPARSQGPVISDAELAEARAAALQKARAEAEQVISLVPLLSIPMEAVGRGSFCSHHKQLLTMSATPRSAVWQHDAVGQLCLSDTVWNLSVGCSLQSAVWWRSWRASLQQSMQQQRSRAMRP